MVIQWGTAYNFIFLGGSDTFFMFPNEKQKSSQDTDFPPALFGLVPPYLHSSPAPCQSKHSTGHWWRRGGWAMSQRRKWAQWRGSEQCSVVHLGSYSSEDAYRSARTERGDQDQCCTEQRGESGTGESTGAGKPNSINYLDWSSSLKVTNIETINCMALI